MIRSLFLVFFVGTTCLFGQNLDWTSFTDSIPTLSSPRPVDLNNDGVMDLVYGGGTDGYPSSHGVMAFDGATGSLLWVVPARNEVFGSAVFFDITNDGVKDIFINGREAQLMAIDGSSGVVIWEFFPYGTNPADSGYYNFYNPFVLEDISGDGFPDLLVANGGDHSAPDWETNRPPGHLMVINSSDGSVLAKAVVPDSAETYCSPVVAELQGDGVKWVLFGTGGENLGGSFWACPLNNLLSNSLDSSLAIESSSDKGYIAPASVYKRPDGYFDFYIQAYDGKLSKINGQNLSEQWAFTMPNTESSAAPVIGNFYGGDFVPDVYLSLFKGVSPSYSDFYQVMLDGVDGSLVFMDSIGVFGYASGAAVDYNNDGRDEVVISITDQIAGYYQTQVKLIDFQNNIIQNITNLSAGVNLGSTPLIYDANQDSILEIAFTIKKDSLNPVGWNGVYLNNLTLGINLPYSGIAWGGYMGVEFNGYYNYSPLNCGTGSILLGADYSDPSCNHFEDGYIDPILDTNFNYTYLWSTSSVDSSIQNLGEGVYWLHITNNQGCYEEGSVSLSDPYVVTFGGIVSPTCVGDSNGVAVLSSTGCPCQFSTCTFLWDNGITTKPNNSLTSGWHYATINYPDGCITYDSVLIPSPLPVIFNSSVVNPTCSGYSDGALMVEGSAAFAPHSYLWNTGDTVSNRDSITAGFYTCLVSDARGCIDSIELMVVDPEEIGFMSSTENTTCPYSNDGSIIISNISGGNGLYNFYLNDSLAANPATMLSEGLYVLQITDSSGCFSSSDSLFILSPDNVNFSFNTTPSSGTGLSDGSIVLGVTGGTPPYEIQWNDSSSQTGNVANDLGSGFYTALVVDSNNCVYQDSVFLGLASVQEGNDDLFVFPNPSKGLFKITQHVDSVVVTNTTGQLLSLIKNTDSFNLEGFEDGFYYARLFLNSRYYLFILIKD